MKNNPSSKSDIKNILVIRFRRVGDAVLSSVLCSSLRKTFPEANIHYVLNEGIAPLFEHHPHIDRLITFSESDQSSFFRYVSRVRQVMSETRYDLIIDTRSTVKTLWFSLLSLGTRWRIGRLKSYNRFVQNHRVALGTSDEVSNTLKLLDPLRLACQVQDERQFSLWTTDQEKTQFRKKMESHGINLSHPVVVCAVTARLEHKVWSAERMTEILHRMLQAYPEIQLVFNYAGERERQNAHAIYEALECNKRIFIDLEASTLRELLALFSQSQFFFGNEGGPRHISQAMNVPSFAIFPPTIPKTVWLPNASERFQGIEVADVDVSVARNDILSFAEKFSIISVDEVWTRLRPMLKNFLP